MKNINTKERKKKTSMSELNENDKIAYTEILNLLKDLEPEYSSKIPTEIITFLTENSEREDRKKYPAFDNSGNIQISPKAEKILNYLNLTYWATDEEKHEGINIDDLDVDEIFKNAEKKKEETEEKSLVVRKNTLLEKIKAFLRKIFGKKV